MKVGVNLVMKENNRRKYPPINENDEVKIYEKKRGNYTDGKETNPKWSRKTYKVVDKKLDIMGNTTYIPQGLARQTIPSPRILLV